MPPPPPPQPPVPSLPPTQPQPYMPPPPPPSTPGFGGPIPAAPGFGAGGPQYPYVTGPVGPARRSGKALAGFILGLASVVLFFTVVVPVLAIIFGLLGAKQIKQAAGGLTGKGLARAGWILGILGLIGGIALWVVAALNVAGTTPASSLEVGQCVDLPKGDDTEVARLDTPNCDEPHDAEVFFVGDLGNGDDPYPGIDEIDRVMAEECMPEFLAYVGTTYGEGELDVFRLYPTEANWEADQGYVCLAFLRSEDKLTESIKDSGR